MPPAAASILITSASLIVFALGCMHLVFTYHGERFHPRDAALAAGMKVISPRISRETTMWRAGIGFHVSHSLGAILFGVIYVYLACEPTRFLFGSPFLLVLGLVFLAAWLVLAKAYWFKIPRRCIAVAAALYAAGLVVQGVSWVGS